MTPKEVQAACAKVAEQSAHGCEITTRDELGWPTTGAGGAKHQADYIATAIRALDVPQAPQDGVREALERIADGDEPRTVGKQWNTDKTPSKHDKCVHDGWMYEDCGQCVAEFARAALEPKSSEVES